MIKSLAYAALGLALTASCAAFAAPINAHQIVDSFTIDSLATAAAGVDYQSEPLADSKGTKALGITAPSGVKLIAQPTACQQAGQQQCFGLEIFALWTNETSIDLLNRFNAAHAFTSTFNAGGNTVLSRYEISDFGVPIGNIASNFVNLDKVAQLLIAFVQSGGASASLTPVPGVKPTTQSFAGSPITSASDEPLFEPTAKQKSYLNSFAH